MRTAIFLFALALVCNVHAKTKLAGKVNSAIYGTDDRNYSLSLGENNYKLLSEATAAMIPAQAFSDEPGSFLVSVNKRTLAEKSRVCQDERFANDPAPASCTGFLVGPDLLVTAGHCIRSEFDCENNRFVFSFQKDLISEQEERIYFPTENIYSCKSIIHREYQREKTSGRLDFALIQLDRPVTNRLPLKFRTEGKIDDSARVVIAGHPSGLPLIVSGNAKVRSNDKEFYFVTNLDSFGGNSGSPVVNVDTGVVEGLLVRGEKDFVWDQEKGCNRLVVCSDDNCRGEDVTRITAISELMPK